MGAALKDLYFIKICSIESSLIMLCRASHSVHGGHPPNLTIFFKTLPPTKTDELAWVPRPHLKMKPPIWKTNHPLKDETLFHEMIPRKSTIINNLKSLLKKYVWRSSFLVNLEACRLIAGNFTIRWTPSQVFFDKILSSAHAPPMFWLKSPHQILRSPPMFVTPVGNPTMNIGVAQIRGALIKISIQNFFLSLPDAAFNI